MGGGDPRDLRERLMQFSLRVLRLCASLPETPAGRLGRGQLLRSGTSPGAQCREACRARSSAEFISKIESLQQELDETAYWLELIERAAILPAERVGDIRTETDELLAIFAASARTAKRNQ